MEHDEPFVHGPVFEQMFNWEQQSDIQMQDLVKEGLLSQQVVDALDSDINKKALYLKTWHPFAHQYTAWKDLLNPQVQSRIITSGTGSGKQNVLWCPF